MTRHPAHRREVGAAFARALERLPPRPAFDAPSPRARRSAAPDVASPRPAFDGPPSRARRAPAPDVATLRSGDDSWIDDEPTSEAST